MSSGSTLSTGCEATVLRGYTIHCGPAYNYSMADHSTTKSGRRPIDPNLRPGEATPGRTLRVPDDDWARWQRAADIEGVTLSGWLRQLANKAAHKTLRPFYLIR